MIHVAHLFEGIATVGAVTSIKKLVDRLDRDKFKPILIASVDGPFVHRMLASGYEVHLLNSGIGDEMRELLSSHSKNPFRYLKLWRHMRLDAKKLLEICKQQKVDIVHSHHHHHHLLASMACKKDVPHIWHMRAILSGSKKKSLQWKIFNYYAAKYPIRVIAISKAVHESMAHCVQDKMEVIYNGIEVNNFGHSDGSIIRKRFGISDSQLIVGVVGRFTPIKGFVDFIYMANIVAKRKKNVHFIIVGPTEIESEFEYRALCLKKITELGLENRFTITGELGDMPALMALLNILILPTTTWEGLGNVVLEAQASGKPVITTDCGGPCDIVANGETGFVVPRADYQAMAVKVLLLLGNERLYEQMAAQAYGRMREGKFDLAFTVSQVEEIYISIYNKLAIR